MILILGSTHDDILYFESVMTERHEETILDRYKIQVGTIFNQSVILIHDVFTSYISSLIVHNLIKKYFVVLVFVVGKCVSFNNDFQVGDIALSRRVLFGDVDQIKQAGVKLGQIPKYPESFETQDDVIGFVSKALEQRTFSTYKVATFISSNIIMDVPEMISRIVEGDYVLGYNHNVVFDCTSGGVCLACELAHIPFISVKVIEKRIGVTDSVDNYLTVLRKYSDVGKAVVTCIGEIGRNEIIRS